MTQRKGARRPGEKISGICSLFASHPTLVETLDSTLSKMNRFLSCVQRMLDKNLFICEAGRFAFENPVVASCQLRVSVSRLQSGEAAAPVHLLPELASVDPAASGPPPELRIGQISDQELCLNGPSKVAERRMVALRIDAVNPLVLETADARAEPSSQPSERREVDLRVSVRVWVMRLELQVALVVEEGVVIGEERVELEHEVTAPRAVGLLEDLAGEREALTVVGRRLPLTPVRGSV